MLFIPNQCPMPSSHSQKCKIVPNGYSSEKLFYDISGQYKIQIPVYKCLSHENVSPSLAAFKYVSFPIKKVPKELSLSLIILE
jgi:hypothetical protein